MFKVNLDIGVNLNELTMGGFKATCSRFENLGLEIGEYRLSGSDIYDSECEFRVFSHCYCHLRFELKLKPLSQFIKGLGAIPLDGLLINVGDVKGPSSAGGAI